MTLPVPACILVPSPPAPLKIRMPGGISIQGVPPLSGGVITPLSSIQSLLTGLSPALAALQPIFLIIDAIVKIMAVFNAIPPMIGGNFVDFFEALKEAAEAVIALVQLQPAMSMPFMILDIIAAITAALEALRDVLSEVQTMTAKADAIIAQAQASGDAAQEAVGDCIKAQAAAYQEHVVASLGPMGQLIEMVTQLAGMMPSPPSLPAMGDASGLGLDELVSFLDAMLAVFRAIKIPGAS